MTLFGMQEFYKVGMVHTSFFFPNKLAGLYNFSPKLLSNSVFQTGPRLLIRAIHGNVLDCTFRCWNNVRWHHRLLML